MMVTANRCTQCRKIIAQHNKKGLCSRHQNIIMNKIRMRSKCGICKEPCSGNMLIQVKKDDYISLCTHHFDLLLQIKDMKEVRKKIKYLRSYH